MEPILATQYTIYLNPALIPPEAAPSLLERLANLQPLLLDIAGKMSQEQFQQFDSGQGPNNDWPELAESTIRRKIRKGYPLNPLVATGLLASHVGETISMSSDQVTVGVPIEEVPYAVYPQYGGEGNRPPQRMIVSVTQEEEQDFLQMIADFVGEQQGLPAGAVAIEMRH